MMAIVYNTSMVRSGLVLHLDAANRKSYPGSGAVWTDLSGNGNTGTLINGVGYSSTNNGTLVFDGVNDYVNLAYQFTQSSVSNVYTVEVSARLSSISAARRQIWSSDDGGFDWGFGAGDGLRFSIFSGQNIHLGKLQDTGWHIFTAQWSASGTKLYIDGILDIATGAVGYDNSISPSTSIGRNPGFGEYWHGDISFVKVYNRLLSDIEITQNFNAVRGRYGI